MWSYVKQSVLTSVVVVSHYEKLRIATADLSFICLFFIVSIYGIYGTQIIPLHYNLSHLSDINRSKYIFLLMQVLGDFWIWSTVFERLQPETHRFSLYLLNNSHNFHWCAFCHYLDNPICSVVPVWSCPIAKEKIYDALTQTRYPLHEIQTFIYLQVSSQVISDTASVWGPMGSVFQNLSSHTETLHLSLHVNLNNALPTAIDMATKNQDPWHDFWLPPRILTP